MSDSNSATAGWPQFWAKLGTNTWPEHYHPVICHTLDVGVVALAIWEQAVREQVRERISAAFQLKPDESGRWLAFWVGAHDIGKICSWFQEQGKTRALSDWLRASDFCRVAEPQDRHKHHTVLGTIAAAELLTSPPQGAWPPIDRRLACQVAAAVGGHHGLFPQDWSGKKLEAVDSGGKWANARQDVLKVYAQLLQLPGKAPQPPANNDQSPFIFLAGLAAVADWIGSNEKLFPRAITNEPDIEAFDLVRYFNTAKRRANDALRELGWLGRSGDHTAIGFRELFADVLNGHPPRSLQEEAARIAGEMGDTPKLVLIEAPMGEGKTEAAWYVADAWDRRGGQGAYVALPTMATSNQMFDRVAKFLEKKGDKSNVTLLYGKAALNEKMAELLGKAEVYDEDTNPSAVVTEAWFAANKKQGLLAPYGVGTIDQALLGVLQTKHMFVRLFGLAGKCVILDEVHAYDAYMSTLLERLLAWLAALGCPVVLLSATLPAVTRRKLLAAYAGTETEELAARAGEPGYPRVTVLTRGEPPAVRVTHPEADPKRRRTVRLGWVSDDRLADELRARLENGGCAVVIRNTVGLAQETFVELQRRFGNEIQVELFHARFPFGRRDELERGVLKRFGKDGGPPERNRRVLVATQVVEQSLDLDFDLMISDVAPVDLILQRAGRLHRHERGERPTGVNAPELLLIEPDNEPNGLPEFGVSGLIYSPHLLFRSLLELRGNKLQSRTSITLPNDIEKMVNAVYAESPPPANLTDDERAFWETTLDEQNQRADTEEGEAAVRQIRKPTYSGGIERIMMNPREEEDPSLHPGHQALTRLARPTVQLICLVSDGNGALKLFHDNTEIKSLAVRRNAKTDMGAVKNLLMGEVAVSHPGIVYELFAHPQTQSKWNDVGMLARHHLVVFANGEAIIGKYHLRLDRDLGLIVTSNSSSEEDE